MLGRGGEDGVGDGFELAVEHVDKRSADDGITSLAHGGREASYLALDLEVDGEGIFGVVEGTGFEGEIEVHCRANHAGEAKI